MGVEIVNIVPVDNPLADPFDWELSGYLQALSLDLVVKAVFRDDPEESVGVLVEKNGKICVVEYTEIPVIEKTARDVHNNLIHPCAYVSLFALKLCENRPESL